MKSLRIVLGGAALLLLTPGGVLGQGSYEGEVLEGMEKLASTNLERMEVMVERLDGYSYDGDWGDVGPDGMMRCTGNCQVYKIEAILLPDGSTRRFRKRLLSALEVAVLTGTSPGSDLMQAYAGGMVTFQLLFNQALTGDIDPTGNVDRARSDILGAGATDDAEWGAEYWMDPFSLIYAGGTMMDVASRDLRGAERSVANSAELAQAEADEEASVMGQLEEVGVEEVAGRRTVRYDAPDPDLPTQQVDGQEFEWTRASLWIDPDDLVIVKHRMEGTATAGGESREFFLEVENSDFRHPPGCGEMYAPYRRVARMGGILDDEQMAEIEQAREQLEEFDRQLAAMPAAQREMAERMMGGQLERARNLVDGGTIEHVTEVEEILCDPDLKALFGTGMEDGRLARIQRNLLTLGYQPGNTRGELDDATRSAISEFQADQGLTVTGEPSAELEELLAAEVGDE